MNWCVSLGFTASIEAGENDPLTDEEIAKLRDLAEGIAETRGLHPPEVSPGLHEGYEVHEVYGRSPGPGGRGVGLSVSEDRRRAGATVTDRSHAQREARSDVKNVVERLRERLADERPERSVEIEEVPRSVWEP